MAELGYEDSETSENEKQEKVPITTEESDTEGYHKDVVCK
jgi:hypothetical protein